MCPSETPRQRPRPRSAGGVCFWEPGGYIARKRGRTARECRMRGGCERGCWFVLGFESAPSGVFGLDRSRGVCRRWFAARNVGAGIGGTGIRRNQGLQPYICRLSPELYRYCSIAAYTTICTFLKTRASLLLFCVVPLFCVFS